MIDRETDLERSLREQAEIDAELDARDRKLERADQGYVCLTDAQVASVMDAVVTEAIKRIEGYHARLGDKAFEDAYLILSKWVTSGLESVRLPARMDENGELAA